MWIKYLAILIKTLESLSARGLALCENIIIEYLLCHASINIVTTRFCYAC